MAKKKVKKFVTFDAVKFMFPSYDVYPICILMGYIKHNGETYAKLAMLDKDGNIYRNGIGINVKDIIEPSTLKNNKHFDWNRYNNIVEQYKY